MACGCEKKDDGKKCNDFTKAVINIENPETLTLFHKVVIPASMGDETAVPPAVGKYCNTLVYYEASEHSYLYSSDGIPTFVTGKDGKDGANGKDGADGKDGAIQYTAGTGINISAQNVISATGSAAVAWGDITGDLENQTDLNNALGAKQDTLTAGANITIDGDNEISATDTTYTAGTNVSISSSNVISATDTTYTDFVGASSLLDGASGLVPKPLKSQRGKFLKGDGSWGTPTNTTYTAGSGLSLNGTEFSVDTTTIQPKLTAGANVNIDANNEISATDTTYSDFTGTDGVSAGTAGLVPAPATTDDGKYLKADGTWATVAGGGSNITMTNVDPGEGQPLAADNYIAVYGGSGQGGFSRYTSNQSIPGSTATILLPGTTQTPDDGVSYTNGIITIQKAGWWMLSATVGGNQTSNGYLTAEIIVNNEIVSSASGSTTANYAHCRNVIWAGKLSIGDTVKVQVTTQYAMNINRRDRGLFSGVLVSAD